MSNYGEVHMTRISRYLGAMFKALKFLINLLMTSKRNVYLLEKKVSEGNNTIISRICENLRRLT